MKPAKRPPKQIRTRTQRINRILSLSGLASRRRADELIKAGRVTLNGNVLRELGTKAIWGKTASDLTERRSQSPPTESI